MLVAHHQSIRGEYNWVWWWILLSWLISLDKVAYTYKSAVWSFRPNEFLLFGFPWWFYPQCWYIREDFLAIIVAIPPPFSWCFGMRIGRGEWWFSLYWLWFHCRLSCRQTMFFELRLFQSWLLQWHRWLNVLLSSLPKYCVCRAIVFLVSEIHSSCDFVSVFLQVD